MHESTHTLGSPFVGGAVKQRRDARGAGEFALFAVTLAAIGALELAAALLAAI